MSKAENMVFMIVVGIAVLAGFLFLQFGAVPALAFLVGAAAGVYLQIWIFSILVVKQNGDMRNMLPDAKA